LKRVEIKRLKSHITSVLCTHISVSLFSMRRNRIDCLFYSFQALPATFLSTKTWVVMASQWSQINLWESSQKNVSAI